MNIALLINPWSGIGGSVALKGSDGDKILHKALRLGAIPMAQERAFRTLDLVVKKLDCQAINFFAVDGSMGGDVLKKAGINYQSLGSIDSTVISLDDGKSIQKTSQTDTIEVIRRLHGIHIDLLLFAGGDGTARDLVAHVDEKQLCLGIPAGVKIHSAVYGITPEHVAEVLIEWLETHNVEIHLQEVRDIDEDAFRKGQVRSRYFGELWVPACKAHMQGTKEGNIGGVSNDLEEAVEFLLETLEDDTLYLIGSGKSLSVLTESLGVENTLLGVDAIFQEKLVLADCRSDQLLELAKKYQKVVLIVSLIGGQGFIFGRGNKQLSPELIELIGRKNIIILSSIDKIRNLSSGKLLIDTGDAELDKHFFGSIKVLCGYDYWLACEVA